MAEQAVRKPPPQSTAYDESSDMKVKDFTLSLSITISSEPPISTYSHFVFFWALLAEDNSQDASSLQLNSLLVYLGAPCQNYSPQECAGHW